MPSTVWTPATVNSTGWTTTTTNSTAWNADFSSNKGYIMDDAVAIMDDATATMDDALPNDVIVNATTWTAA